MYYIKSLTEEQKQLLIEALELAQRSGMAGSGGTQFEEMFDFIIDCETVNLSIDKRKQETNQVLKTFELLGELNKSTLDHQVKIGKALEKCNEIIKTFEAVNKAEIWKNQVMSLPKQEFKKEIECEFVHEEGVKYKYKDSVNGITMNKNKIFTLVEIEDRELNNEIYQVYKFKNNLDDEETHYLKSDILRLFDKISVCCEKE